MERRIAAGLVAGLIAGIVFTLVGPFLTTPMPGGEYTSMLVVSAEALHSHGRLAGWVACLVYTVIIGGIFGWLVSAEPANGTRLTLWGGLYGLAWWIVSGLVLIPALLAKVPLSSAALDATRPVALASLIEHVLYGVILGLVFTGLVAYGERRHEAHDARHHAV